MIKCWYCLTPIKNTGGARYCLKHSKLRNKLNKPHKADKTELEEFDRICEENKKNLLN